MGIHVYDICIRYNAAGLEPDNSADESEILRANVETAVAKDLNVKKE